MFFNELELIPIIAETRSFSKAAKLLHLSQPAISSKIQTMEDYYGVKLFNRTTQGVTLTEAGKMVCAYAVRFIDLHNSMDHDLEKLLNISQPWLTIGSSCTVGNYAMPCIIRVFKEKFPDANMKLDIGNSLTILDKLKRKEIDVAVVEGKVDNPLFVVHHIDTLNLVLVDKSKTGKKKEKEISIKELIKRPFILREEGAAVRVIVEDMLKKIGFDITNLNVILEGTSIHVVKSAIEEGFGLSIVPAIAVEKELQTGMLRNLKIKELEKLELDISLVYLADEEPSIITRKFIHFITHPEKTGICMNLKCNV